MIKLNKPKDFNLITPEEWFINLLTQFIQVDRTNDVLFELNNHVYMIYYKIGGYLRYDYSTIYLVLKNRFYLNYEQIDTLIKSVVEDNTNLKSVIPLDIELVEIE